MTSLNTVAVENLYTVAHRNPSNVSPREAALAHTVDRAAHHVARWGLVAILLAFGAYKFTAEEAAGIQPLLANSPLFAWMYSLASLRGVSGFFGVTEIAAAALLASHRFSPRAGIVGGVLASFMFASTLSFLFTTPGVLANADAFGFLVKDVFLLGAALLSLASSLQRHAERARSF